MSQLNFRVDEILTYVKNKNTSFEFANTKTGLSMVLAYLGPNKYVLRHNTVQDRSLVILGKRGPVGIELQKVFIEEKK